MLKLNIPEDLEEMIKDIIAHRELKKLEQHEDELLYAELPCYSDDDTNDESEGDWKIEIEL